ncbi:MAG TPA: hypothetical protein VF669_20420 [Tepidisphaeraceae bacterium]|jgi:hypothetical protein
MGSVQAHADASGGTGGSAYNGGIAGDGGGAVAHANASTQGTDAAASATSYGGAGGGSPDLPGKGGSASATAIATSAGDATAVALATSTTSASATAIANGANHSYARSASVSGNVSAETIVESFSGGEVEANSRSASGLNSGTLNNTKLSVGTTTFVHSGGTNSAIDLELNGTYALRGGTLTAGAIHGTGVLQVDGGALVAGSNSVSSTFDGVINGGSGNGGSITKLGSRALTLSSLSADAVALSVNSGTLKIKTRAQTGGKQTIRLNTLSINQVNGAALDFTDNNLVVNSGSFTAISAMVWDGYSTELDTTKTGIISSTAQTAPGNPILAVFDNALLGSAEWPFGSGDPVSSTAIVGQYAYLGDADLNGMVTSDDYGAVDSHLGQTVSTAGNMNWFDGDWNFDGEITPDDYGAVDANLGRGMDNPLAAMGTVAVPEPAGVTVITVAATATLKRRRRRHQ